MKYIYIIILLLLPALSLAASAKIIDPEYFRKQGDVVTEYDNYYQIEDHKNSPKEDTIYYVTKTNHPGHPFYFEIKFFEQDGKVMVKVHGEGTGNKDATDIWFEQIKDRIEDLKKQFSDKKKI